MHRSPQQPKTEAYKLTSPFSLNIPRCRHLKVNGTQCGSPALKDHRFCFFHQQWHERKLVIKSHISRENTNSRVPLDKREGVVKAQISWAVPEHRWVHQRRLRTKTLEISRRITLRWKIVPPTIDSA